MEKRNLPNATAVIVLSSLSLLTCCCFGIFGVIFGAIALYLAQKDMKLYNENPDLYLNFSNLNTGRILAIVALSISTIFFLYCAIRFATISSEEWEMMRSEIQRAMDEAERNR